MGFPKRKDNLFGDSEVARVMSDIAAFRDERDWGQFHSPRNLAAALAVEASELQELMLWKTENETQDFLASASGRRDATYEVADVLIYALLFCNALGIEPIEAIRCKLAENASKYPVDTAKGNAVKYTQLPHLADKEVAPGGS
jgi:NTP pyrophosphatase (non-canonical NTP hydrolase)